jgi:hypothetical protein
MERYLREKIMKVVRQSPGNGRTASILTGSTNPIGLSHETFLWRQRLFKARLSSKT